MLSKAFGFESPPRERSALWVVYVGFKTQFCLSGAEEVLPGQSLGFASKALRR